MARRSKRDDAVGGNWLDTYADMVTLLLTFFVLLYASSNIDEQKYQLIRQSFQNWGNFFNYVVDDPNTTSVDSNISDLIPGLDDEEPYTGIPTTFDQLYQYLSEYIQNNNLTDSVELERGAAHLYMRFRDNVFFAGNSDILLPDGRNVLNAIAPGIEAVEDKIARLIVAGHTAFVETSPVNDWELSAGRAFAVNDYIERLGILPSSKLGIRAYGSHRPISNNDTEDGKRLNRRVEIIILRNDADMSDPAVVADLLRLEYGIDIEGAIDPDGLGSKDPKDKTNSEADNTQSTNTP